MILLAPIASIIAGAIAIPALIALYMLKLRRRPLRIGSTMLWDAAIRDLQANIPLRWIRPSWLLLLHLLAVALLVIAVGRPALPGAGASGSLVVIAIDRSASMSARDGGDGRSRFQEAQLAAKQSMESAPADRTTYALVALAADAEIIVPNVSDRQRVLAAIDALTPTDQPLDADAARSVLTAIATGGSEDAAPLVPASIVLFTDAIPEPLRSIPGARVIVRQVGPDAGDTVPSNGFDNTGITVVAARRDAQTPGSARVFARLMNAAAKPRDVVVTTRINGAVAEAQAMKIEPGADVAATFEIEVPNDAVIEVRVDPRDLLDADNVAWLVLGKPRRTRVLLVSPDASWILADALSELDGCDFEITTPDRADSLLADDGARPDLVVFDRVTPLAPPSIPSISVDATMPGSGVRAEAIEKRGLTPVLAWDRRDAITRDVSFDGVLVGAHSRLIAEPGARVRDLAVGPDGALISVIENAGPTRIVIGFDLAASNWPLQPGFPVFLASAVEDLTGRGQAASGLFATTASPVSVDVTTDVGMVTFIGPETIRGAASMRADGSRRASLGRVRRAGIYLPDSPEIAAPLAVNLLNVEESSLAVGAASDRSLAADRSNRGTDAPTMPRELWHLFILGAALILGIEWVVYAWSMRA